MNGQLSCLQAKVTLAPFTSWQVGGPADWLALPTTIDELKDAVAWGLGQRLPLTILGGGTNCLISDQGVRGLVIGVRKLSGLQSEILQVGEVLATEPGAGVGGSGGGPGGGEKRVIERLIIECLAGTAKTELLKIFLKHRLPPALFLAGLPGDAGGGVVMNAGVGEKVVPREFTEIVDWIEVLRWDEPWSGGAFKLLRIKAQALNWSYRHCEGWRPGIITRVGISWPMQPIADILQMVKQANQVRLSRQPLDMPSCGSVFVNPDNFKAGQLIEQCGLKGYAVGGAKVSEKHANFIVNTGGATAADIHNIIEHVRTTVQAKTGVKMRTEVVYLGEWGRNGGTGHSSSPSVAPKY